MTNRDHFIAALDADPSDQLTRAVFADWLEEHGDGDADRRLAAGLRWMAANNRRPYREHKRWTFRASKWWDGQLHDKNFIPLLKFEESVSRWFGLESSDVLYLFESRHAAEVALAESLWAAGVTAPPKIDFKCFVPSNLLSGHPVKYPATPVQPGTPDPA